MDRKGFFRLLGAGGLLGLLKGKAQGLPWTEETFAPTKTANTPINQKTLPTLKMPARELLHLDPETKRRFPWLTLP